MLSLRLSEKRLSALPVQEQSMSLNKVNKKLAKMFAKYYGRELMVKNGFVVQATGECVDLHRVKFMACRLVLEGTALGFRVVVERHDKSEYHCWVQNLTDLHFTGLQGVSFTPNI